MTSTAAVRDLGSGLVVRQAGPGDVEGIVASHAEGFRWPRQTEPNARMMQWIRELIDYSHPFVAVEDTIVAEDTGAGKIVSAITLISQTWTYDGVPFKVGQPELASTHPDYRGRGLMSAIFEMLHAMSASRGEIMQVIDGIPSFYRRFGYELALEENRGRLSYAGDVPALEEEKREAYRFRPANAEDIDFVMRVYERGEQRHLISCVRDPAIWHFDILGRSRESGALRRTAIVQKLSGEPIGYVAYGNRTWEGQLRVYAYELSEGISWVEVTPALLRYLKRVGEIGAAGDAKHPRFVSLDMTLGSDHPAYHSAPWALGRAKPGYAYYVRLPDLRGFVELIAPALERRLADSIAAGHTGKLEINNFGQGVRIVLERGRIAAVEDFRHSPSDWQGVLFPNQTFLQVLFGLTTMAELAQVVPDCGARSDEARALIGVLFPRGVSNVWSVK